MSSYQNKLDLFWKKMSDCPYELPEEMKPHVELALKTAGFDQVVSVQNVVSGSESVSSEPKTKRLSGYNLYMREKSIELKAAGVSSGERMGKIASSWKALSKPEQEVYNGRAKTMMSGGS